MAGPKQMDSASVQALIDKLRDLASIKFLDQGFTTRCSRRRYVQRRQAHREGVDLEVREQLFRARENEPAVYELDARSWKNSKRRPRRERVPATKK